MPIGSEPNYPKRAIIYGIFLGISLTFTGIISSSTRETARFFDRRLESAVDMFPLFSDFITSGIAGDLSHYLTVFNATIGIMTLILLYFFAPHLPFLTGSDDQEMIPIRVLFIIGYWLTWSVAQLGYVYLIVRNVPDLALPFFSILLGFGIILILLLFDLLILQRYR